MADMSDAGRSRRFRQEQKRQLQKLVRQHRQTAKQVRAILTKARTQILAELAVTQSEYQAWLLPNVQSNIEKAMAGIGEELAAVGIKGADATHALGVAMVDEPLAAGGLRIAGVMPEVDLRQLMAIRTFMTDRLKNVAGDVGAKVKAQIGMVMVGGQSMSDAVEAVSVLTRSGRGRAITILRTEMGRAYSVAAQERMTLAREHIPGLKKQWRRSGKIHSRIAHDLADGQVRDVDKPFSVGTISMRYPRDPKAPASETINCGCVSLPFMEDWEVRQPGRQAFSDEEVFNNPAKRDLAHALNPEIDPAALGLTAIRELEALPQATARKRIASDLATNGFRAFVTRPGQARDHRAVAVMPDDLKKALGASTSIVRLSGYTAVKQRVNRRGQQFTASDYGRVQAMLDKGTIFQENERNLVIFADGWKAVIKRTGDGKELFLQSLHRSNDAQLKNTTDRLKVIKKGK